MRFKRGQTIIHPGMSNSPSHLYRGDRFVVESCKGNKWAVIRHAKLKFCLNLPPWVKVKKVMKRT